MTKGELEEEAVKYLENFNDCANCKNRWGDCADQLDEYCLINGGCYATPKEQDIYLAGAEPREKRIVDLEKENAELRKVAEFQQSSNMNRYFENKKLKEAKEIIKKLVNGVRILNDPKVELTDCDGFLAEAEQFISEVEK